VDDFAMFAHGYDNTLALKERALKLLSDLGLKAHPTKGYFLPTQVGEHLGMVVDYVLGEFRAPTAKLISIASLAKSLLCEAAANKRCVSVKALASVAGKYQFLNLAIPAARFFLRELHDVVSAAKSWSGTVQVTCQFKRDLLWWTSVPSEYNGVPIHMETHQERVPSPRLKWLQLGRSAQRLCRNTGFLDSPGSTTTHHVQGAEGCTICNSELPAGAQRTASSFARGQKNKKKEIPYKRACEGHRVRRGYTIL
jgi:hypothetical protein